MHEHAEAFMHVRNTNQALSHGKLIKEAENNRKFSDFRFIFLQVSLCRFYDYLNPCPYFYFKELLTARTAHGK